MLRGRAEPHSCASGEGLSDLVLVTSGGQSQSRFRELPLSASWLQGASLKFSKEASSFFFLLFYCRNRGNAVLCQVLRQ